VDDGTSAAEAVAAAGHGVDDEQERENASLISSNTSSEK
jgi:hypothetical protein